MIYNIYLQGPDFCGETENVNTCVTAIEGTMPYAIPVLAEFLAADASNVCNVLTGLC